MRPLAFVVLALGAACAARRVASAACDPVPAEFQRTGPVFRDCAVDSKARPPARLPDLRPVDRPTRGTGCSKVVIDMVIDTSGVPIIQTAKVVEANDPGFQDVVLASLGALRYRPALKNNEKVAQLVRYERKIQYFTVVAASSGGVPAPRPTRASLPDC